MPFTDNAAHYFVDRHVGQGRSEKIAFREAGDPYRQTSYGELSDRTSLVASALARSRIRREERAFMLVLDQIEFPEIFWGCLKAGVVAAPVNTLLAPQLHQAILEDCRPTILFLSEQLADPILAMAPAIKSIRQIVVIGDTAPDGAITYAEFLDGVEPGTITDVTPDDVAFWLYSSGSTGRPKGVRHVHGSLKFTADTYGRQVLNIAEDDVVYSAAKLFFAYGLGNSMTFPMSVGATSILNAGRPTPENTVEIIAREKPTVFCGVPTLYAATIAHLEQVGTPDVTMRVCISAGEALPEDVGRKWQELWKVDILDGVGSTEMLHIFLSNREDDVAYGTSGVAVPGYDLRLVDENGESVPVGEIGELLVRGNSAADGYWNQRQKSRATFEGEWTHTGDKYEQTSEGRFVYCGRTDDMFKVSGIWVSPFEVEQALIAHPGVLEAAVVAAADENGLQKPKAFIVLKDKSGVQVDPAHLQDFVKDRVGKWKYPRWVEYVDDLPKTATGKIQRFKLREDPT